MKTYIFVQDTSGKRGYDVNIRVYRMVNNIPKSIGNADYQTRGWKGARGEVATIIAKAEGFKTDGYQILRKDVQIFEV